MYSNVYFTILRVNTNFFEFILQKLYKKLTYVFSWYAYKWLQSFFIDCVNLVDLLYGVTQNVLSMQISNFSVFVIFLAATIFKLILPYF